MYLIRFKISSSDSEFDFTCFSKVITVVEKLSDLTYSTDLPPNYIVRFNGNYSAVDDRSVRASFFNFMLGHGVIMAGINVYKGSVYVSGYSSQYSLDMTRELESSGITIDQRLGFDYMIVNDVQIINCSGCVIIPLSTDTPLVGNNPADVAQTVSELYYICL